MVSFFLNMKIQSEISLRNVPDTFNLDDERAEEMAYAIDNSDEACVMWDLLEAEFEAEHQEVVTNPLFVVADFLRSGVAEEILDDNGFYKVEDGCRTYYERADMTDDEYDGQQWPERTEELPNGEILTFSIQALSDRLLNEGGIPKDKLAEHWDNRFAGYCETTEELMRLAPQELADKFDLN